MPELPEVESVRRSLAPHLVGRRLEQFTLHAPKLRWPLDAKALQSHVRGRTVAGLRRRAKYLLIDLVAAPAAPVTDVLAVHLGMTGWFGLVAGDVPRRRHDHVEFSLDDGRSLRLYDPRRFGALFCFAAAEERVHVRLAHLGPEPLDDAAFNGPVLHATSRNVQRNIKALLMDATCVVGVGNIYASEALYRAGVDPRLRAHALSRPRAVRLAEAVRATLREAITLGGTTLRDFRNAEGSAGFFAPRLLVYGRAGEPCRTCATPVRRLVMQGRSTYFCPGCQRR